METKKEEVIRLLNSKRITEAKELLEKMAESRFLLLSYSYYDRTFVWCKRENFRNKIAIVNISRNLKVIGLSKFRHTP